MNRILAAALAAAVCAPAAQAQSVPEKAAEIGLTLQRALELAGAASPNLEAAAAGVRAAEAQRRGAALRPNPSISIETENVVGSGGYRGFHAAETTVGLALPVERGGKRSARIAVADSQVNRVRLETAVARAELVLRVTQAFNRLAAAERHWAVAQDQLQIANEGLRVARVRIRAGRASPIEEQRAGLARANAETAAGRAERDLILARGTLGRLIGREPGPIDLGWFERLGSLGPREPARAEGMLALALAEADLAAAGAQLRLARSQRIPDVTVSAGARRLAATNDVAAVFGVSVPLPMFDNGRAGVDAARARREQAEASRRAALLEAQQAIASAEVDLANAEANARTANGPALAAAAEAARIARIGYREGKFGQLDLIEAERTLAETRAAAIDALAAHHDAEARLARLTARAPLSTEDQP